MSIQRVWINLICRIYLRIYLRSDSRSIITSIKLPVYALLHQRSARLYIVRHQICWNQYFKSYSDLRLPTDTQRFLSAVHKLMVVPECSCLLFVVSCFIDQSFVETVCFYLFLHKEITEIAKVSRGSVIQRGYKSVCSYNLLIVFFFFFFVIKYSNVLSTLSANLTDGFLWKLTSKILNFLQDIKSCATGI